MLFPVVLGSLISPLLIGFSLPPPVPDPWISKPGIPCSGGGAGSRLGVNQVLEAESDLLKSCLGLCFCFVFPDFYWKWDRGGWEEPWPGSPALVLLGSIKD